ncbi:MAG TPA: hypothetical protein VJ992_07500 [Gemmatimonadales bacterium]|nr:hypothetical protein [Gemmatimonadales bacterium]
MRIRTLLLPLIAATTLACTGPAGNEIEGTWRAPNQVPGASFTLNLSERAGSVSGTGAYSIEAGQSGTIVVAGGYTAPKANLTFNYSDGRSATYVATLDSGRMAGVETFGDGTTDSLVLNRQ